MKKFLGLLSAVAISTTLLPAQYNSENLVLNKEEAVERFSFDKLRIYPITANRVFIEAHKSTGNFKPLKAGLEDGSIKIIERGAAAIEPEVNAETLGMLPPTNLNASDEVAVEETPAEHRDYDGHVIRYEQIQVNNVATRNISEESLPQQRINNDHLNIQQIQLNDDGGGASDEVNKLFIQNTGNDSIFIMAGEVVKGGKQDRVIAMDMVIPPHSEPIDLSVFCVEHGRWTYDGSDASDGFTGHANVANTSVRKAAVVSKNQSEVWSKVEEVTTANDAQTSTGTLNALEKDADYQKELKEYEAKFGGVPTCNALCHWLGRRDRQPRDRLRHVCYARLIPQCLPRPPEKLRLRSHHLRCQSDHQSGCRRQVHRQHPRRIQAEGTRGGKRADVQAWDADLAYQCVLRLWPAVPCIELDRQGAAGQLPFDLVPVDAHNDLVSAIHQLKRRIVAQESEVAIVADVRFFQGFGQLLGVFFDVAVGCKSAKCDRSQIFLGTRFDFHARVVGLGQVGRVVFGRHHKTHRGGGRVDVHVHGRSHCNLCIRLISSKDITRQLSES